MGIVAMNDTYSRVKRDEVEALREQVDTLQEKIYQLESILGSKAVRFPSTWKLSVQQTAFLGALYKSKNGYRSYEHLSLLISSTDQPVSMKTVCVVCSSTKKLIKKYGIRIDTRRADGFQLTLNSRKIIERELEKWG